MAEPPIDLTLERLNRLERLVTERFDAIDKRFDTLGSSLGKMVTRTEDSNRMSDIDRRLRALEERQPTP
jgi:hypothetical protein